MKDTQDSAIEQKIRYKFCNIAGIPIKIHRQPYFSSRIKLFDKMFGAEQKFNDFMEEVSEFKNRQAYFEFYNSVVENAISTIRNSQGFKRLSRCNMVEYAITNKEIKEDTVYNLKNDGESFISIDLIKANFTALKWFDTEIVASKLTYEMFIQEIAGNYKHLIESKYLRQTILRKCDSPRQTKIGRYLMDQLMTSTLIKTVTAEQIVCFNNDEIIIHVTKDYTIKQYEQLHSEIKNQCYTLQIDIHCEWFTLHNIENTSFYYKKSIAGEIEAGSIELKCVEAQFIPFILRQLQNEEVNEEDLVFMHEGRLAKLLETPVFKI